MKIAPLHYATNFDIRLPRSLAIQYLLDGDENVMCKEYGDDEDWVGLTMDDLDENNLLDEDYVTLEYFVPLYSDRQNVIDGILERIYEEIDCLPYEHVELLKNPK